MAAPAVIPFRAAFIASVDMKGIGNVGALPLLKEWLCCLLTVPLNLPTVLPCMQEVLPCPAEPFKTGSTTAVQVDWLPHRTSAAPVLDSLCGVLPVLGLAAAAPQAGAVCRLGSGRADKPIGDWSQCMTADGPPHMLVGVSPALSLPKTRSSVLTEQVGDMPCTQKKAKASTWNRSSSSSRTDADADTQTSGLE